MAAAKKAAARTPKEFREKQEQKCRKCPCYTCDRPVPKDGSGVDCTNCTTNGAISSCTDVDASNTFACGHVGEGRLHRSGKQ